MRITANARDYLHTRRVAYDRGLYPRWRSLMANG
jgi:hypothetical protein